MTVAKPVIATPIDAKGDPTDLKEVSGVLVENNQSQKLFVVSEGPSFEDQAGFFGRW